MSTRHVAIIQARMGSSRFPGKMLALLDNAPSSRMGRQTFVTR